MHKHLPNILFVAVVVLCVTLWAVIKKPWESGAERAYRLCQPCGLSEAEVDSLIQIAWDNTLTPEEVRLRIDEAFNDFDARDIEQVAGCVHCVRAIFEAAAIEY